MDYLRILEQRRVEAEKLHREYSGLCYELTKLLGIEQSLSELQDIPLFTSIEAIQDGIQPFYIPKPQFIQIVNQRILAITDKKRRIEALLDNNP